MAARITETLLPPTTAGDAAQLRQAIETALDEGGFKGHEVVISLPPEQMIYRQLHLAPMPIAEVAEAVHWQMAREMGWSLTDFSSDFYTIGNPLAPAGQGHEVIAAAALMEHLHSHVDLLNAAGMVPIAVDADPSALARIFVPPTETNGEASPLLVLDVGEQTSTLIVIHQGRPISVRSIAFGRHKLGEPAPWEDAGAFAGEGGHAGGDQPSAVVAASATEVAHKIMLCLHSLGSLQPCQGYELGLGGDAGTFLAALTEDSGIFFQDEASALQRVEKAICIEHFPAEVSGNSLVPLGLALYGHSPLSMGASA